MKKWIVLFLALLQILLLVGCVGTQAEMRFMRTCLRRPRPMRSCASTALEMSGRQV